MTSTSGATAASRSTTPRTSSNRRPWANRSSARGPGEPPPAPTVGVAPVRAGADLRHEPCQLAAVRAEQRRDRPGIHIAQELPEGLDERSIGQPAGPERQAAAGQDTRAPAGHPLAEALDQAGLADARLAGDEHDPGLAAAGAVVDGGETLGLGRPTDERGAASLLHVAAMIGAPARSPSRPSVDQDEPQAHAVMPASSRLLRRRPRARHRRVRVAGPDLPIIVAISSGR